MISNWDKQYQTTINYRYQYPTYNICGFEMIGMELI